MPNKANATAPRVSKQRVSELRDILAAQAGFAAFALLAGQKSFEAQQAWWERTALELHLDAGKAYNCHLKTGVITER